MVRLKHAKAIGMAFGLLASVLVWGAIPPEKKKPIEQEIQNNLEEILDKLINEKQLADRFGFEYPVKEPAMTLASVEGVVDERVRELSIEAYPKTWVNKELAKMSDEFAQWETGDKVKGTLKDGKTFDGWLRSKSGNYIQVNAQRIRKEDLSEESLLHVDVLLARKKREQERVKLRRSLEALRQRHAREIRLEQVREIYKKEGYIRVKGRWMPKLEFFRGRVNEERARYQRLLEEPLRYKHFYEAGYRKFKGEWYTPEEVKNLRYLARVEEELNPEFTMQELDILNAEGLAGGGEANINKFFGDDTEIKPESKEKKDDAPIDEF